MGPEAKLGEIARFVGEAANTAKEGVALDMTQFCIAMGLTSGGGLVTSTKSTSQGFKGANDVD